MAVHATSPQCFWEELSGVGQNAREVWQLIGSRDRRRLGVTLIPMFLTAAATNGVPLLLSMMVDQLTHSRDQGTMQDDWTWIALGYVALIGSLTLAAEALLVVRKYLVNRVCTRIERNLSVGLMAHLFRGNLQALSREQIGVVHGRTVRGVEGFIMFLKLGFKEFFPLIFSVVTALGYGFYRSPWVGLLMLVGLLTTVIIAARQLTSQKGMHLEMLEGRSKLDGKMIEQLEGIEYIRAANTVNKEIEHIGRVADERLRSDTRLSLNGAKFDAIKSLNDWAVMLAVLIFAIELAVHGRITIGDIVAFVGLSANMARPLRDLHRIVDDAYEMSFHLEDLLQITDETHDPSFDLNSSVDVNLTLMQRFGDRRPDVEQAAFVEPTLAATAPLFRANHIVVEYEVGEGRKRRVLDDVTLEIRPGETIGFAGPSGSGKSTLLKVMLRLTHPTSGYATLGGVDLERVSRDSLGRCISYVGQSPYVFSGTIAENIAYGCSGEIDLDRIIDAAQKACIHEEIMAIPGNYQALLHQRGQNISGGQRQRIALARAFLKNAPILILDEGTSALDNISEAQVQRTIEDFWRGRTVLMVAHRLTTLRSADRIVVFDDGRIVQVGTAEELSEREGVFRELIRTSHGR